MSTNDGHDWTSMTLVDAVRAGEARAWDRMVEIYAPLVYGWCRRSGLNEHDSRDVGQEVFADVVRRIADFRRDRPGDSFRGWLGSITRFKTADFYRARNERAPGGTDNVIHFLPARDNGDGQPHPFSEVEESDMRRDVLRGVMKQLRDLIGERDWLVLKRTVVDGQSAPDVAEEFGLNGPNVRQIKKRALARLREKLAELELTDLKNEPSRDGRDQ